MALVTHNSEKWLPKTLASINRQINHISAVSVVDDCSLDSTNALLGDWLRDLAERGIGTEFRLATSTDSDMFSRIAMNFLQAARRLQGVDAIALADHDDTWLPHRIEVQSDLLEANEGALMLASNGNLRGASGTLFDAFEVPRDLSLGTCRDVATHVIRSSVATGGASMVRPALLEMEVAVPPPGWLHDRWWSVVAASRCGLLVDETPVIDYRVDEDQQVGLDTGRQRGSRVSRITSVRLRDLNKLRDLHRLRTNAQPVVSDLFGYARLGRTLAGGTANERA